jgi:hypothetical protein
MAIDLQKILEEEMVSNSASNVNMTDMFNKEFAPSEYSTVNEDKVGTIREDVPGIGSRKEALQYAATMGFADTYRGLKQIIYKQTGVDDTQLKADQAKLNRIFANKDYGKEALGAYMGGVIADPFGWVIPLAKAKSVGSLVKQGITYGAGFGAAGYTDENMYAENTAFWEQKLYQAGLGAVGGGAITGTMGIIGRKTLGFDDASKLAKIDDEKELARINKLDEVEKQKALATKGSMEEQLTLTSKLRDKVGQPLYNKMTKNPLAVVFGGAGAYAGANYLEESNNSNEYLWNTGLSALGLVAGLRFGKFAQNTKRGNDILYKLNSEIHMSPDVYNQWNKMKGTIQEHQGAIGNLHLQLSKLSKEENKLAYQLFSGDLSDSGLSKLVDDGSLSQKTVDNLLKLKEEKIVAFRKIGEDMRDAGLLSDDVFKTNLDSYLRRSYTNVLETKGVKDATKLTKILGGIRGDSVRGRGVIAKAGISADEVKQLVPQLRQERMLDSKIKTDYEKRFADGDDVPVGIPNEKKGKLINRVSSKADPDYNSKFNEFDQPSTYGVVVKDNEDGTHDIITQLTKAEREGLGEIEDAALSISRTAMDLNTTLGLGKFFKSLNDDGISKGYVFDKSQLVGKGKQFKNEKELEQGGYKTIPNQKIKDEVGDDINKFGAMNGKVVTEQVYKDMELLTKVRDNDWTKGNFKTWFNLQKFWKKTKTVYNPAVHMNNLVANFSMYYMANGSWKVFAQARKEFKDILKFERGEIKLEDLPKDLRELYQQGGLSADLISAEMKREGRLISKYDELSDTYKLNGAEKTGDFMTDALKTGAEQLKKGSKIFGPVDRFASDWYQLEDKIFRYALYKTRKQQINPQTNKVYTNEEATKAAIKYFIDYDIKTPFINTLRNTAVPFLSYSYRVIPLLLETAVVRPQKFAVLAAMGYTANDIFTDVAGSDRAMEKEERRFMQDFRKKKMFDNPMIDMPYANVRLPYNSIDGGAKYFDISRKLPGSNVFELGSDTGGGIPYLPMAAQPGGPIVNALNTFLMGRDSFTGRPFNEMGMTPFEILGTRTSKFAKDFIPNVPVGAVTGALGAEGVLGPEMNFASQKITQAFSDDYQTLSDPLTPTEAILNTFGLTVNTADIERLSAIKSKQLNSIKSQFSQALKNVENKRRKGIIDFEEYQEQYKDLRERLMKEMKEVLEE